jgi:hypothetical protein
MPGTGPRCIESPMELNFCATMSSRTDLKSSRKIVSDAHLKTSARRQYGLIPLLGIVLWKLTTKSVTRNIIDSAIHVNMTPKRLLIHISVHTLNPYVFLIARTSFTVVKTHHGSRSNASQGRVRILALLPRLLKYSKLDQASTTQKGWTQTSEMINKREAHSGRKGRIFSHDTTLCRK